MTSLIYLKFRISSFLLMILTSTIKQSHHVMNELRKLHKWLMVNRLSLNIDKTNHIVFHPYNKPLKHIITLKFHKKAILEKNNIKYLGVMIDSALSQHTRIENILKMSRGIGKPHISSLTPCY